MQNQVNRVVSLPFKIVRYDEKDRSYSLQIADENLPISYPTQFWAYEEKIEQVIQQAQPAIVLPQAVYEWLNERISLNWQSPDKIIAQAFIEHTEHSELSEWLKKDGSLFKLADAIRYGYEAEEVEIAPIGTIIKVPLEVTGHKRRRDGKKVYQTKSFAFGINSTEQFELTEQQIRLFLEQ